MLFTLFLPLILQIILIAINAFFACTEIAVISLNEEKYRRRALEGDKRAAYLSKLMERPARFLATIQVGITLAGFLASAFAANSFSDPLVKWFISLGSRIPADTLDTICVIVITLILSYFTLVFGELVPKRIAMHRSEKIARRFGRPIYYISKITAPIVLAAHSLDERRTALVRHRPPRQHPERHRGRNKDPRRPRRAERRNRAAGRAVY